MEPLRIALAQIAPRLGALERNLARHHELIAEARLDAIPTARYTREVQEMRERIHKLIFCAPDSSAVFGGLRMLLEQFDLKPNAISGLCSSSTICFRY